jgi:hypothetical protein
LWNSILINFIKSNELITGGTSRKEGMMIAEFLHLYPQ